MSDFQAQIKAILDLSGIPSDIKKIESEKIKLSDIKVDTDGIKKDIQNALKDIKLDINVGGKGGNSGIDKTTEKVTKLKTVMDKINSYSLDASISKVTMKYSQYAGSGHAKLSEIETDLKEIQSLQNKLNSGSSDNMVKDYDKLQSTLKKVQNNLTIVASEGSKAVSSLQVKNLDNKIQVWCNNNTKAVKVYGESIEELRKNLQNVTDVKGLNNISNQFKSIQTEAKATGNYGKSLTDQFKSAAASMTGFVTAGAALGTVTSTLKDMYNNVVQIDTAMTNLYKVTDETSATYDSFLSKSYSNAQELGKSVSDVIEQTSEWAKLGYSLDESTSLSKISSIYSNVGELSNERSVSDLVTAMKAFNIEAKDAITIVDSLNKLGNEFAVSSGDLGEGLSRSASALALAGSDINELLAMLTGGSEITQNAAEFGNFMKVAVMRIRGMKGDLEELGEEVDDSVDSISKVQTQILNITHGSVNIFDDSGNFRDYYKIMEDIADIYDRLSSTEQASLTEILFGKQRGNQGAALIQAFKSNQIQKALEASQNATGSAMQEQERWLESIEAKIGQLSASWQTLSNDFLSSDFIKASIDALKGLLDIIDALINSIGIFGTALSALSVVGIVKNLAFEKNIDLGYHIQVNNIMELYTRI